jgi:CheY-like chemotaxis protein
MSTPLHNGALLVADDDETEIELISIAISALALPLRIDVVHNGQAALDYLRSEGKFAGRPPGAPRLVILDNKMPIMNGLDALREIRADRAMSALPVVMFSASADGRDITEAYAAGVNSYVVKPMRNFSEVVQSMVKYWVSINTTEL